MRNGQITDEFLYATEAALCMASYQASPQMVVIYIHSFAFFLWVFCLEVLWLGTIGLPILCVSLFPVHFGLEGM